MSDVCQHYILDQRSETGGHVYLRAWCTGDKNLLVMNEIPYIEHDLSNCSFCGKSTFHGLLVFKGTVDYNFMPDDDLFAKLVPTYRGK